jgi:hypothetical protein
VGSVWRGSAKERLANVNYRRALLPISERKNLFWTRVTGDTACILSAVYSATNTPVSMLAAGSILIPAMVTGVGEFAALSGTAVLGSSGWVEIGGIVGGQVLNIPKDVWSDLSIVQQQGAMSSWMQSALSSGSQIVFTNDPALAEAGSGLAFEYQYILDRGLQVVQSGTSWIVVR